MKSKTIDLSTVWFPKRLFRDFVIWKNRYLSRTAWVWIDTTQKSQGRTEGNGKDEREGAMCEVCNGGRIAASRLHGGYLRSLFSRQVYDEPTQTRLRTATNWPPSYWRLASSYRSAFRYTKIASVALVHKRWMHLTCLWCLAKIHVLNSPDGQNYSSYG